MASKELVFASQDEVKVQYGKITTNNTQSTLCYTCEALTIIDWNETKHSMPKWVQSLFGWKEQGLVSETEFQNSLSYLSWKGIIDLKNKTNVNTLDYKNKQLQKHERMLSEAYNKNLYVSGIEFFEPKHSESFSMAICKKQNDIVTLDAEYTNNNVNYSAVFFKLLVYNDSKLVASGLGKIVDVSPNSYRHISISTPFVGDATYCFVAVDSKFH
jgi:hypothetical protein